MQGETHKKINTDIEIQIQIHLAEYSALTTKETYFITLQNSVLGVMILWSTYMTGLSLSKPENNILGWVTILGIQIFGIISAFLLYEQYEIVSYIEDHLKGLINELLNKNNIFWKYQTVINSHRTIKYSIWEYSWVTASLVLISVFFYFRFPKNCNDYIGLLINLIALIVFGIRTHQAIKLRKTFGKKKNATKN